MANGHERYERLAVGHVVGGLDDVDGATFRAHLLQCRDCRARVSELRDIASTLAATEREERAATRGGSTEVRTRPERDAPPEQAELASWREWPWRTVVIGLVPLLVLAALAWAVWSRAETRLASALVELQEEVLEVLATGDLVEWSSSTGVDGLAATDGETIALDLEQLPSIAPDQGIVVWQLDDAGVALSSSDPLLRSQAASGRLIAALPLASGADELLVTIEQLPSELVAPTGAAVLSGSLPAVPAATAGDADPSSATAPSTSEP